MFKRILLVSNLSPAAEPIINAVYSLHLLGTEEVVLVHCLKTPEFDSITDKLTSLLQAELNREVEKLKQMGFTARGEILIGHPGSEINRVAQEKDCSIIVTGSHGYTQTNDIPLCCVTEAILHTATRPVLIIKITSPAPQAAWNPLRHILYPTDFSKNAEVAFEYLKMIVQTGAEKVTLLHIQDKIIGKHLVDRLAEFNEIDEAQLRQLRDQLLSKSKVQVDIEIPFGLVAEEIINRIKNNDISMVVMGTQGRGHIGRVFLGSVGQRVVWYSSVPILLVPLVK